MALQQEIWVKDIQELLYPANSILLKSTDDSAFCHFKTVHVPNAGANAAIVKNRSLGGSLAGTTQRTDNEVTYAIDSYSVDPVIVSELETYQISYDKRKSILFNSMKNLETVMANNFLYGIAPSFAMAATSIFYTTGAAQGTDLAYEPTATTGPATGTRKAVLMADIFNLKTALDKQNVPDDGKRVLLVPSDIFNNELLQIANILQSYQLGSIGLSESVVSTGVLAKIAGFEIMVRPTTVVYDMYLGAVTALATINGSGIPVIYNSSSTALLAWHPESVSHAQSTIDVFYQEMVAQAYGSLISFNVFAGSAKRRFDNKGIVALVQG